MPSTIACICRCVWGGYGCTCLVFSSWVWSGWCGCRWDCRGLRGSVVWSTRFFSGGGCGVVWRSTWICGCQRSCCILWGFLWCLRSFCTLPWKCKGVVRYRSAADGRHDRSPPSCIFSMGRFEAFLRSSRESKQASLHLTVQFFP